MRVVGKAGPVPNFILLDQTDTSFLRSGTVGSYRAMQILGCKPLHMYECCAIGGVPHTKVFKEAVTSECNWLSGIKRYTRAEFDKWLADYDVSSRCIFTRVQERKEAYI